MSLEIDDGTSERDKATLTQTGNGNKAAIYQGYIGESFGNTATLAQTGNENNANIFQGYFSDGHAKNNTAKLTQTGDGNRGDIFQGAGRLTNGTAETSKATLTQTGNSNDADIYQGSGSVDIKNPDGSITNFLPIETDAFRSEATISQQGSNHYAAAIQAGTGGMIDIQQRGSGNYSVVAQGVALP